MAIWEIYSIFVNVIDALQTRLTKLFARPRRPAVSLGYGLDVYVGMERRIMAERYRWNGEKRGADPSRPYAVIQYTLAGAGLFKARDREYPQTPGALFAAVAPSAHEYYQPETSPAWAFFWVIVHHPYVVGRIGALAPPAGPVLHAPPDGPLVTALVELVTAHRQRTDDRFTRESRLFDLVVAFDRTAWANQHRGDERENLLARVRILLESPEMARPNVDEIASVFGMSRSNFSHHFRTVTGLSPAMFIRDLRLQRARDMLLTEDHSMKAIARLTGFADTNHLCKAFRGRFGFTPGAFRRQMRVSSRAGE